MSASHGPGPVPMRFAAFLVAACAIAATPVPVPPAVAAAGVSSPSAWPDSAVRVLTQRARGLRREAKRDSALRVLAPVLAPSVRARLSPAARVDLIRIACTLRGEAGDTRGAIALGREGLPIAKSLHDTTAQIGLHLYMAAAYRLSGRAAEARAAATEALGLSRRKGDLPGRVTALNEIATIDAARGKRLSARRMYAEALAASLAARDSARAPLLLGNLGIEFEAEGRVDSARICFSRALRMAESARHTRAIALMQQRLATLDVFHGDPSDALARYAHAARVLETNGITGEALAANHDRAEVLFWLGRRDEARNVADSLRAEAARLGQGEAESRACGLLGRIELAEGRPLRATVEHRRALDMVSSPGARLEAATQLAQSLIELDSLDAAAAVLAGTAGLPPGAAEKDRLAQAAVLEARIDLRRGHHEAAIDACRRAEAAAEPVGALLPMLDALKIRARCERALGRAADAARTLDRGLAAWESKRALASDPQWRERYSDRMRGLASERVALALVHGPQGPAAAERALAVVERYKARTLLERVHEPGRLPRVRPAPAFDLAAWRRASLGPEDVFVESFAAADTTWIFALTRDQVRIYGVGPMSGDLGRRIERLRAAVARRPERAAEPEPLLASAGAIGRELLGPIADLLRTRRRVLVSPDDRLALIPFGLLSLGAEPLAATHQMARVPSAVSLTELRRRATHPPRRRPASLLAFAGPRPGDGRPLPGAQSEVASIRRAGPGVRVVQGPIRRATLALAGYDALHFAAHSVASDRTPWTSGILLDGPSDDGGDPYLRASAVAAMRLDARLAVLSGCETAGGAEVKGEGVIGLSGAFLAAGVPSVVAALWKVDDRSAALLMERFYAVLADGRTAAEALGEAQAALRRDAGTAHPYHWAGYVVHGAPDVRLPLRAR